MAKIYLQQNRDTNALAELRAALRIDPNNIEILTFTAQVLAASENPATRDGRIAFTLAAKANLLTSGRRPPVLDVLGMACAELGKFDEAQMSAQSALEVANALTVLVRRRKLTAAERVAGLGWLRGLPVRIDHEMASLAFSRLSELAVLHRLSVYDAAYLELAQRRKLALGCMDGPLREAAKQGLRVGDQRRQIDARVRRHRSAREQQNLFHDVARPVTRLHDGGE